MSRTSVIYIEYRKNPNSPWRWVRPLMSADDVRWAENEPTYMVDIYGNDNKQPYKFVYELSKQGTIRDLFNDHDVEFNDRGFPSDMSIELKNFIDSHPDEFDGIWGKSYATISEIASALDVKIKTYEGYKQEYIDKENNISLHEKLNYILKFLSGEKDLEQLKYFILDVDNSEKRDEDNPFGYSEYIDDYNECIDDFKYSKSFIDGINQIVDFCTNTWTDDTDIRLIYFTC